MADEERSSKKRHGLIRILISLAFLGILTFISFTLISGRGFNFDRLTGFIFPAEQREAADELFFNIGRSRVFADLNGAIAAAGSLGVQVLDYAGSETLRESVPMNSPTIRFQNERAIAFDIGGTEARVFNRNEIIASITKNGSIVSASINHDGWFTVDLQPGGGYKGNTYVYNNDGRGVYRVFMSTGYILSSVLSYDSNSLAILNLTDYGSRVTFYHGFDKEEDDGHFELPGVLIIEIMFLESGDLLAVTTESLMLIDPHSLSGWEVYSFSGLRIGGYAVSNDYIALNLLDFGIGHRGKLIVIDLFGNLFGEVITTRELISMSFVSGYLTVMLSDGLIRLDRSLTPLPSYQNSPSAAGVSKILALDDGATLVAGDRFAIIVR